MNLETFRPTLDMLQCVAEVDEFKGTWRSMQRLTLERLAALKHVATIESVGSSTRIEGVTLTDQEVEALLSNLEARSFRSRDEEEVAGYADVMQTVYDNWADIPLTEAYIKQLHGILLKHSHKDARHRGEYKTLPNNVEAFDAAGQSLGTIFKTATPFNTPMKMTELVTWMRETLDQGNIHPLIAIGAFTVVFLAIHPFQDGNGRLSRVLTALLLLKAGYNYIPYTAMESIIEGNKEGYYLALRKTQGTLETDTPNWDPWLSFFLQTLKQQKARLEAKIAREKLVEGSLPELSVRIIELVTQHGRLQISAIERLTGEKRSTLKVRLSELVSSGRLARHGKGPATWYTVI